MDENIPPFFQYFTPFGQISQPQLQYSMPTYATHPRQETTGLTTKTLDLVVVEPPLTTFLSTTFYWLSFVFISSILLQISTFSSKYQDLNYSKSQSQFSTFRL